MARRAGTHVATKATASRHAEASAKAALTRIFVRPRLDATWRQARDHVLASFALRGRLDTIADRVRAAPVADRFDRATSRAARSGSDQFLRLAKRCKSP